MAEYQRIVSYLYKYNDGQKGENTGFVRVETRADGLRLFFHIKDLRMMDERKLKAYFYFHKEGKEEAVFVDEFLCSRGICEYKCTVREEAIPGWTELRNMAGMVFFDNRGLLYGTCWDEQEIQEKRITFFEEKQAEEQEQPEQREERSKKQEQQEKQERPMKQEQPVKQTNPEIQNNTVLKMEEVSVSSLEQMMREYPKVPFQWDAGLIEAVRIAPEDIARLPMKDWHYAGNGFLVQGYEIYHYLILGRISMKEGQMLWVLGVPGVYHNREKYLAQIFGFYDYIPVKQGELKTGGFGFWIAPLSDG